MRSIFFQFIHTLVTTWPRTIVIVALVSAAFFGVYGGFEMELIANQDQLLSEDLEYHARYMDFIRRFGDLEFLYVLIEGPTKEGMISFAEDLKARLQKSPDIHDVIYKLDTSWVKKYALHFASVDELQQLKSELQENQGSLDELSDTKSVDSIVQEISNALAQQSAGSSASATQAEELDTFIAALKGEYESPFSEFYGFEEEIEQETGETEYFWSNDQKALLMLIMPEKDYSTLSVIEKPLNRIRTDILLSEMDHEGVTAGLTGRPALQADEMATTNEDMKAASIYALVGVSLLFMIFFREITRPALAMVALLIAMGWTYGFVALTLGHLNLLSSVFALILIGLGVDFGIHLLHRYQEELKNENDPKIAVSGALRFAGSGIITGALTSSVAFLSALTTDFKGLAELGYVSGVGIVFCLITMLVVLSAMLYSYDALFRGRHHVPTPVHLLGLRHVSRRPWVLALIILIVSICLIPQAFKVKFDDNLLNLQAEGLESVTYEHKLINASDYSTWYCAFVEQDLESARQTVAQLEAKETVAKVDSISSVLPKMYGPKMPLLSEIHSILTPYNFSVTDYQPNRYLYENLRRQLDAFLSQIEQAKKQMAQMQQQAQPQANNRMNPNEAPPNLPNEETVKRFRDLLDLLSGSQEDVESRLIQANQELLNKPKAALQKISQYSVPEKISIEELPQTFQDLYIGKDGSFLVMAYPKENIWQHESMREFVGEMREIDPKVTGTPVQVYESSLLMRESFQTIGLFSLIAVTVMVFLDFLSLRATFFVITPLLLGVLWLVEIMGVIDLHLNMANFFAIPILIGIGVDNAVHIYHRFEETGDIEKAVYTTGSTLTLTSLTTGFGFGSLMGASHQGLASFGVLMAIGTATCWFSCVVVLPLFVRIFSRGRHIGSKYDIMKLK